MGFQDLGKTRAVDGSYIFFVGKELDAAPFKKRHFRWKAAGRFVLARQFLGFDLAGFYVWLVKCVDSNDGAGDSRGNFPPEEFLAEGINVRQSDSHDGMPGLVERGNGVILGLAGFRGQAQISENPIVPVSSRLGEAFAINRNNALTDFSGGFGN